MTVLLAHVTFLHPGLHAHPHAEGWMHSLTSSPWAVLTVGAAVLATGYALVRARQRD